MFRVVAFILLAGSSLIAGDEDKVKFYGDLRLRLESDWDSHRADGTERDDRDRARFRARLGMKVNFSESWAANVRVRSGSKRSQQSPHITFHDFDGNDTGDHDVIFDRWVLKRETETTKFAVGRSGFSEWHEMYPFWDSDVTLPGVGGGMALGERSRLSGGVFLLPDGAVKYNGEMLSAEWFYSTGKAWKTALSIRVMRGEEGAEYLRNGNGDRDYDLLMFSSSYNFKGVTGGLKLKLDLAHNFHDYDLEDGTYSYAFRDERDAAKVGLVWGALKEDRWILGVYYAHVEALGVHASYSEDDWIRWGGGGQADASDMKGYEIRVGRGIGKRFNMVLRYFDVESPTSLQDGQRARLDINYHF